MPRKDKRKVRDGQRAGGGHTSRTLPPLEQLYADIHRLRRTGWPTVSIRERGEPVAEPSGAAAHQAEADRFVESLGLRPLGYSWVPVDGANARIIARRILHKDLAYMCPVMTEEQAKDLTTRFFAFLPEAHWYGTNGWPSSLKTGKRLDPERMDDGWGWNSMTDHTFDRCVVAINATHIGILGFADED